MANMGEFGSLLQLGFGIGVGLSLFRAPIDLRATALEKSIDDEMRVLRGVNTSKAANMLGDLSSLKLRFADERDKLNRIQRPFLIAIVLFALLNWTTLVLASLYASYALSRWQEAGLIFISVGIYVAITMTLEIIARIKFQSVSSDLENIRRTRAPP